MLPAFDLPASQDPNATLKILARKNVAQHDRHLPFLAILATDRDVVLDTSARWFADFTPSRNLAIFFDKPRTGETKPTVGEDGRDCGVLGVERLVVEHGWPGLELVSSAGSWA